MGPGWDVARLAHLAIPAGQVTLVSRRPSRGRSATVAGGWWASSLSSDVAIRLGPGPGWPWCSTAAERQPPVVEPIPTGDQDPPAAAAVSGRSISAGPSGRCAPAAPVPAVPAAQAGDAAALAAGRPAPGCGCHRRHRHSRRGPMHGAGRSDGQDHAHLFTSCSHERPAGRLHTDLWGYDRKIPYNAVLDRMAPADGPACVNARPACAGERRGAGGHAAGATARLG
jgi:hypothetical protein